MMCYSSMTYGFDGVIECLDAYYRTIKCLRLEEIIDRQKEELLTLNEYDIQDILNTKDYQLLKRYVVLNKLDKNKYEYILNKFKYLLENKKIVKEELSVVQEIISLICIHLGNDNEFQLIFK